MNVEIPIPNDGKKRRLLIAVIDEVDSPWLPDQHTEIQRYAMPVPQTPSLSPAQTYWQLQHDFQDLTCKHFEQAKLIEKLQADCAALESILVRKNRNQCRRDREQLLAGLLTLRNTILGPDFVLTSTFNTHVTKAVDVYQNLIHCLFPSNEKKASENIVDEAVGCGSGILSKGFDHGPFPDKNPDFARPEVPYVPEGIAAPDEVPRQG